MTSPAATISAASLPPPLSAGGYRRQARRLRHHFRNDLSALHLSLRALAARRDEAYGLAPRRTCKVRPAVCVVARDVSDEGVDHSPVVRSGRSDAVASVLRASAEAVNEFATEVRSAMDGGVLRHAQRTSLLRRATRLGIDRFEAALVIAAVENQGPRVDPVAPASGGFVLVALAIVVVQCLLVATVWWFLRG